MNKSKKAVINQIAKYGARNFNRVTEGQYSEDLHHELFNMTYFGEFVNSIKALNTYGTFDAIGKIVEYEKSNLGEVSTDLSDPDKVVNMLSYIIGEELLGNCPTLQKLYGEQLTASQLLTIKKELLNASKFID